MLNVIIFTNLIIMEESFNSIYHSPLGPLVIEGTSSVITTITFLEEEPPKVEDNRKIPTVLDHCAFLLTEYFAGRLLAFDIATQLNGTSFQLEIWKLLIDIPFGKTISYLELSKRYGDVNAIRAVGAANGKNPLPIIVPCHRVIGSKGELTGYSGKIWRKKWMLEHENSIVSKQQSLFSLL